MNKCPNTFVVENVISGCRMGRSEYYRWGERLLCDHSGKQSLTLVTDCCQHDHAYVLVLIFNRKETTRSTGIYATAPMTGPRKRRL